MRRSAARAAETVEVLRRHPAGPVVEVVDLHAGGSADALVSTVPAEAQPDLVGTWAAPLVFEALYDPWPTPWARWSQDEGATLVGGLDLLVHQAALQLTAMTGAAADVEAMRAAGLAALAARA